MDDLSDMEAKLLKGQKRENSRQINGDDLGNPQFLDGQIPKKFESEYTERHDLNSQNQQKNGSFALPSSFHFPSTFLSYPLLNHGGESELREDDEGGGET